MGTVQIATKNDVKPMEKSGKGAQFITREDVLKLRDYYRRGYKKDDYFERILVDMKTEFVMKVMGNGGPKTPEEYNKLNNVIGQSICKKVLPRKLPSVYGNCCFNLFWHRKVLEERNKVLDACAEKLENNIKEKLADA